MECSSWNVSFLWILHNIYKRFLNWGFINNFQFIFMFISFQINIFLIRGKIVQIIQFIRSFPVSCRHLKISLRSKWAILFCFKKLASMYVSTDFCSYCTNFYQLTDIYQPVHCMHGLFLVVYLQYRLISLCRDYYASLIG